MLKTGSWSFTSHATVTWRRLRHRQRRWLIVFLSVQRVQLARKQKQAEENKQATVVTADQDKTTGPDLTDIPLSLPYQEPEREKQDSVGPLEATAHPSDEHDETPKISAPQTLTVPNKAIQSTVVSKGGKSKEVDTEAAAPAVDLKVDTETTSLAKEEPSWSPPCASFQLQIANEPSAPALYPSLPTLEEMSLVEEPLKTTGKGPAVLALPEQESSPPSLQVLDSVAEISRYKLYPELPKTAPEFQVIMNRVKEEITVMKKVFSWMRKSHYF